MEELQFADLKIDLEAGVVSRAGAVLPVTDRSFELLRELLARAPDVVPHRELLDAVWPGQVVTPETLKQRVRLLRQALGEAPGSADYIVSVHGRGYRLGYPAGERHAAGDGGGVNWMRLLVTVLAASLSAWILWAALRDDPVSPPAAAPAGEAQPAEAPPAPQPDTAEEPP